MIRSPRSGERGSTMIIESLPVLGAPCIHAMVKPQVLVFGSNSSTRYVLCPLCRGGAGAHLMVAKNGKGKWRYLMFQLMFSLEGRAMRAWDAHDDAPLAPPFATAQTPLRECRAWPREVVSWKPHGGDSILASNVRQPLAVSPRPRIAVGEE